MYILQFGATGQVSGELLRAAAGQGVRIEALTRRAVDLSDVDEVEQAIRDANADAVINAAAFTAVDLAEQDEDEAFAVNAAAPAAMAKACEARCLPFIHLSTDYIFNGRQSAPYLEDDAPDPINVYGRSKLAGEEAVGAFDLDHIILRTSWVYSAMGRNFVKTMLRLGEEHGSVRVVEDQIGAPTAAADIANAVLEIAKRYGEDVRPPSGVYHFTGAGRLSWADFAEEIFRAADMSIDVIRIPTSQFPTPAERPANSVLDCSKIERTFGIKPRSL
ncbi:MAG: dTDP-4-dehydrorhamnose reductase, partial [Pseudomonadota bacterium]